MTIEALSLEIHRQLQEMQGKDIRSLELSLDLHVQVDVVELLRGMSAEDRGGYTALDLNERADMLATMIIELLASVGVDWCY